MPARLLSALLLVVPTLAWATGDGPARMDHIAQIYQKENGFSASVSISRGRETLLERGYGVAVDTPYSTGTITMQFTAAALLLLQEDGKLRIDDPLSAHLPEAPAGWSKVTLRHLLTHRSGIGGFETFPDAAALLRDKPAPRDLMQQIFSTFPTVEADKVFALSSPNYILLGLVIEQAAGVPYGTFLDKRLFAPLGMKATAYHPDASDPMARFLFSAGGVESTVQDLAIWEKALFGGKVLSPAALKEMTTPSPDGFYGLGLLIVPEQGHPNPVYAGDSAMLDGHSGVLAYRPDDGLVLAMLGKTNHDVMLDLARKLAALARGDKVVLKSEMTSTALPNVLIPTEKLAMPGLDRDRGLRIYVPPGYSDHPDRRYPVIYMHDAQNLFDVKTAYSDEWGVDETLNELAKTRGFEAIVVGVDNSDKRMSELNPYPGPKLKEAEGPAYMRFIVEVVKPYIDHSYRTLPDRDHTAIIGSSLGGLISHYALQAYPQIFSKYGLFSPSYWSSPELVKRAAEQKLPPDTRLYVYCGGKEGAGMAENARAMAATLARQGSAEDVSLHIDPDAEHNEKAWRPEFRQAVLWLFATKSKVGDR